MNDPKDDEFKAWLKSNPPDEEINELLREIAAKFPGELEQVFGPKQPFDASTRPYDIYECKDGGWGVVLSVSPSGADFKTVERFATKEAALAFVAEHTPRNS